ncbi:hypothetical protein [Chitinophaga niabensis]|uniref:Uncharacterized protein n=1 Tax=Chitinophaga niabensis TaxID=536979 RepID=A0A1N6D2T4_9BACT|nr:hypothetical protein [Chitinophaga niabensis]SIN65101.1 hypothetical protein SAMN04488055_0169 [Chitinophaga niabensis]
MSLLNNSNKKGGKRDNKQGKNNTPGVNNSSFLKPGKQTNISKKPIKTGGARGS